MTGDKIDILKMARPSVIRLKPYASAKEEFKNFEQDLVYLDANENPYENGMNRYPDPNQTPLRNKISAIKRVRPEQILLGNGSDEILDMIYRVFFEPGKDNIIINVPTFGMFEVLSNINDISCQKVLLKENFQLDVPGILAKINKRTKAVFICSPNNPTGNLMKKEDILKLLELELLVIIDEAYIDFSDTESWLTKLDEFNNLIVTQTFSKAYGLAGIRLGACYANSQVIDLLKKIKMPYNVNVLTQKKALEYIAKEEFRTAEIKNILANKLLLEKELSSIGFVKKIYPSDSNFLLIKVDEANKRYEQLIHLDLVVRNRTKEPLCENCLRITVGTTEENNKLMQALRLLDKNTKS
jgi:histidinol-phosphate aminotransferase